MAIFIGLSVAGMRSALAIEEDQNISLWRDDVAAEVAVGYAVRVEDAIVV